MEKDARKQLHASLALLPVDSGQVEYLYGRLLQAQPQEVVVIREALLDHRHDLTERLWTLLENPKNSQDERFRAACALASYAPDDPRWEKVSGEVAATLVIQKPFVIAQWTDTLKGVGKWLLPPLAAFLVDEKRSVPERGLIASVYGTYAANVPEGYARLEKQLTEQVEPSASREAKIALAKKQASIGIALLVMGRAEKVWPLLQHRPDPTARSFLIERLGPGGVDVHVLIARLDEENKVSAKRAILLSLGAYGVDRFALAERQNLVPRLLQLYRNDPDPGLHGATDWLLRQWQAGEELKRIDQSLATGKVEGRRRWYVNRQGQTLVVVPRPGEVWLGEGPERQRRRINRSYAIASKEVTLEQFRKFRKAHPAPAPTEDCPVDTVSWYEGAEYCNWLSQEEGIPEEQWCYPKAIREGMQLPADYLQRTGYRLPTEWEWEYGCRAGATTSYSFGESDELIDKYGWHIGNSVGRSHPVGGLKPNDWGLFDMHGNAWEWTQSKWVEIRTSRGKESQVLDDKEDILSIKSQDSRVLRGGSFGIPAVFVSSANRYRTVPTNRYDVVGFRPARTFR